MVHVSPILLDLLVNPIQAILLTPTVWNRRAEISRYWKQNKPDLIGVTIVNPISYILILVAMTAASVSQIAPVREVSTLIGAAIGGRLFGERHLGSRLAAASIIVHNTFSASADLALDAADPGQVMVPLRKAAQILPDGGRVWPSASLARHSPAASGVFEPRSVRRRAGANDFHRNLIAKISLRTRSVPGVWPGSYAIALRRRAVVSGWAASARAVSTLQSFEEE